MWGKALQPVIQPTHIHGCCGHDMLEMSARLSDVARTPQTHRPHPLGMNTFDACSPGICLLELFGLLPLAGCL